MTNTNRCPPRSSIPQEMQDLVKHIAHTITQRYTLEIEKCFADAKDDEQRAVLLCLITEEVQRNLATYCDKHLPNTWRDADTLPQQHRRLSGIPEKHKNNKQVPKEWMTNERSYFG